MARTVQTRTLFLFFVCLAIAAALQIPIAWAWAYFYSPNGCRENSVIFNSPNSATDPPDRLRIENRHYTGVRWITVGRWVSNSGYPASLRSNFGEPYDSNPVYPLTIDNVFPGITDAAAWPQLPPGTAPSGNIQFVHVDVLGLPFPCVWGRMIAPPGSTRSLMEGEYWIRGRHFSAWPRRGEDLVLPFRPLPTGYILNTLVWGLPLFALTFIPPAIRRSLRRRRGLCPTCAYDLRATPAGSPCPECGNSTRLSSPAV